VPELADSLRDVESHLKRKTERLHELEGQLAIAEAAQKQLHSDLERERSTAALQLEQERKAATAQLEEARKSAAHAAAELNLRLATEKLTLVETVGTLETRSSELAATQARLAAQEQQVADLRSSTATQATQLRHQARDLAELRRRTELQAEALTHSQGLRGVLEGLLAERDSTLADIEARHAADLATRDERVTSQLRESAEREAQLVTQHGTLAAALAQELESLRDQTATKLAELEDALRQRTEDLALVRQQLEASERKVIELTGQLQTQQATVGEQQEELAALRATDEAARAGVGKFDQQQERIGALEEELAVAQEKSTELELDRQIAREQIARLESDARASISLLGNLQQNMERLGREDSGARPALKLVGSESLPERYLESDQDGSAAVHPVGRRTTIGRTPDNDIQIVATFISRNHAVMLGSAQHCIIEDLNSTNGVQVNGRRITRQTLQDGDTVTIGQTRFRYRQKT
jgi:chromosome segregation ATPase